MLVSSRKSLKSFLPSGLPDSPGRVASITSRMHPLLESNHSDLPIESPRDMWNAVERKDAVYLQRTFDLPTAQMKMLLCEIIDAQDDMGHEVHVSVQGTKLTVRTTTHEFGEPTERDRKMTRHIDTVYDEMRQVYK